MEKNHCSTFEIVHFWILWRICQSKNNIGIEILGSTSFHRMETHLITILTFPIENQSRFRSSIKEIVETRAIWFSDENFWSNLWNTEKPKSSKILQYKLKVMALAAAKPLWSYSYLLSKVTQQPYQWLNLIFYFHPIFCTFLECAVFKS